MRGFLVMAMFVASLSGATWNGFELEHELTVDTRTADAFNFEEDIAENSWRLDESIVAGTTQVMDAPCDSWHVANGTDYPVPDII